MRTLLKNLINAPAARQAVRQFEKWIYCHSERSEESNSIRELQKEILRLTPQNDNCRTACLLRGMRSLFVSKATALIPLVYDNFCLLKWGYFAHFLQSSITDSSFHILHYNTMFYISNFGIEFFSLYLICLGGLYGRQGKESSP